MSKQCASLHYVSAAHGGWGIVRMAALVPEAHLLFVCPSACGRHNAIGGAVSGIKHRVSYLFLTEADIVSGDFEQMIVDNVDILFEMLPKKPKALLIFTSCLDDLLGTDHEPILEELSRRNPDVKFRHCTMNPISLDSKLPPGITTYRNMFSLLEKKEETKNTINVLGSNVTYDPEEVMAFYKQLSEVLSEDLVSDVQKEKEQAEEAIRHAAGVIEDYPIAVDYQAVMKPYSLALMLARHGFHAGMIASDSVPGFEKSAKDALDAEFPDTRIVNPMDHNAVKFEHEGEPCLCIGFDCGYMTGSDRVVNLMEDEGMFGFYGIQKLMKWMEEAFEGGADVQDMIVKAGLII